MRAESDGIGCGARFIFELPLFDRRWWTSACPISMATPLRRNPQRPWRTLPLIALTGLGQLDDVKRSHEADFARHLTKPFDMEDLEKVTAPAGGPLIVA
jgi:hypothetical protein